jgi:hypothetical protein
VDNAAVVAALVGGEASFLLQYGEAQGGEAACDFHGGGEADDSSADYDEIKRGFNHCGQTIMHRFPAQRIAVLKEGRDSCRKLNDGAIRYNLFIRLVT